MIFATLCASLLEAAIIRWVHCGVHSDIVNLELELFTPNSDPTIEISQQKLRNIRKDNILPIIFVHFGEPV